MSDEIDAQRVRLYVDRHDDPAVPQVLGRFLLPPSAADEVRKVVESPGGGRMAGVDAGKDLYRHFQPPRGEGWGGYLPSPPGVGGSTLHKERTTSGGVER